MHGHFPTYVCCIYIKSSRVSIGLWQFMMSHPDLMPHMQFLFVRPVFCLGLPSDKSSRDCPCLWLMLPLTGCIEDLHLLVSAPCRAHIKKSPAHSQAFSISYKVPAVFNEEAYISSFGTKLSSALITLHSYLPSFLGLPPFLQCSSIFSRETPLVSGIKK